MSWTEKARSWVKKQLNISSEELEPIDDVAIKNIRTQYTDRLRAHWQASYEAYTNGSDEPEFPFAVINRDGDDLPDTVKEAIAYYIEQIERSDIGSVQLQKNDNLFIVNTKSDGDDGWVELYSTKGETIGCGRTFIELVSWGEKNAIRKMTADSSFPLDMENRFGRTLWKRDAV